MPKSRRGLPGIGQPGKRGGGAGSDGPSAEGTEDDKRARGSSRTRDWMKEIGKVSAVFHSAHSKRRYMFPKPFEIAALAAAAAARARVYRGFPTKARVCTSVQTLSFPQTP